MEKEHITFPQYNVLLEISRNGPLPMSRLGDLMLVAPANVTGLVDRMELKGYVVRKRDRKDRRLWVIEMTPEGKRTLKGISGRFRQYTGNLSSDVGREQLGSTLAILRRIKERVEETPDL